jgi:uncharacterized protein (DUF305 family)
LNLRKVGIAVVLVTVLVAGVVTQMRSSDKNFNDADVRFVQMMIPHHEQAITMAQMAIETQRGASRDLQDIALGILDTQSAEVDQMNHYLDEWHASASHNHDDAMMQGILTAEELRVLDGKDQRAFDRAWAKAMVRHHRGAIAMARDVIHSGKNLPLRKLAQNVITAQHAEILQLQTIARRSAP